jgi:hypothetical protein
MTNRKDDPEGAHPARMYRIAVEFLAEREGVSRAHIYREALDALIASHGVPPLEELERWEESRDASQA